MYLIQIIKKKVIKMNLIFTILLGYLIVLKVLNCVLWFLFIISNNTSISLKYNKVFSCVNFAFREKTIPLIWWADILIDM